MPGGAIVALPSSMSAPTTASLFAATFTSVFLAELGDKTQLATMALSGAADSSTRRWIVFVGAASALVATSALGVLVGASIGRFVSPPVLNRVAGVAFLAMGVWMLVRGR
jgi:putative Ca2+/H+ antiporter (TMEM165/GDT1 family)